MDHDQGASPFRLRVPERLPVALAWVVAALLLVNIALQAVHYAGHEVPYDLRLLFDVDEEPSVPSWYSSTALLVASLLLLSIARLKRRTGDRDSRHWHALSLGFAAMSLDEIAAIHEQFNTFMDIDWTIPAGILVLVLVPFFAGFVLRLPARTRWRFLVAGGVYLAGALGVEAYVGNPFLFRFPIDSLAYQLMATLEEGLEMAGIVLLIRALLRYMSGAGGASGPPAVDIDVPGAAPRPETEPVSS